MESQKSTLFVINAGSSSIKFSVYKSEPLLVELLSGEIANIGSSEAKLSVTKNNKKEVFDSQSTSYYQAACAVIDLLEKQVSIDSVIAIGHRVVHGLKRFEPEYITPQLLVELKNIQVLDPEHLPNEIMLIELFCKQFPNAAHIACFDTFFHASMPRVAKLLSIPRRFFEKGVQRYGFHGISYAYLMEELEHDAGRGVAKGKVIIAHLGSGSSLAAIEDGKSKDTSMGFTPSSGVMMSTRTGDIDPGVIWYLTVKDDLSPKEFNRLVNEESGLLGLSETSADMKTLLQNKEKDYRAAEAVDLFCYQIKKYIGAYTTVLEGLDTIIFSGGIGEHSPEVRSMICTGLEFMGIELDEQKNLKNETIISSSKSKVCVRVIKTNEQVMIAKLMNSKLNYSANNYELCKQ